MGGYGSSETFDVASSLLRVGARFVVGSLWLVVEDCAKTFSAEFYERIAEGTPSKLRIRRSGSGTEAEASR